jgi:hypothetical protein
MTTGLRNRILEFLHLDLAQDTRDYVPATREQFIAAREPIRMDVGGLAQALVREQ